METQDKKKVMIAAVVVILVALVVGLDIRRRVLKERLNELSVRLEQLSGNAEQNREAARQIVEKVRRLIRIPEDTEPTVASIVDVEALREKNPFYEKAENGDYLVVTKDRAILYDPEGDIIIDIVPVQIQPATPPKKK